MPEIIIADASIIIALEKINILPLLCKIYSEIIIPEAVLKEIENLSLPCFSIRAVHGTFMEFFNVSLSLMI